MAAYGEYSLAADRRTNSSEHGNHPAMVPDQPAAGGRIGIGASTAERAGWGGAAVVLRAGESLAHGEGRQRFREGMDAAMPEDAPPNGDAPPGRPLGPHGWVSEMQA